jgi:flagellar hook-associated protein 3 FlgL
MVTRIGDAAQATRINALMLDGRARIQSLQTQVASGRSALGYDMIPRDAGLLLRNEDLRVRLDRHLAASDRVIERARVVEGAVGNLADLAEQMRAVLMQRLNEATGSDMALDLQASELLQQAVREMNVRLDNRYLLAGSRTDVAPVELPGDPPVTDPDPDLYYRGDGIRLSARLDGDVTVRYGITADREGFANLIAAFGNAIEGHRESDRDKLELSLEQFTRAIAELARYRGKFGAMMKQVETIADNHHSTKLYLDESIAGIVDADLPLLVAQLAEHTMMLEASYMVTGQLSRLSLVDYLR